MRVISQLENNAERNTPLLESMQVIIDICSTATSKEEAVEAIAEVRIPNKKRALQTLYANRDDRVLTILGPELNIKQLMTSTSRATELEQMEKAKDAIINAFLRTNKLEPLIKALKDIPIPESTNGMPPFKVRIQLLWDALARYPAAKGRLGQNFRPEDILPHDELQDWLNANDRKHKNGATPQ